MGRLRIAKLVWLLLAAAGITASSLSQAQAQVIAISGGKIRSQTEAGDFIGTILIRDGKIIAMGRDVVVPAGAAAIDATNCIITPGLIDARGTLGLNAAAANEGARDATLNILDAVDPFNDDWRDAARQGVTAVYVQPAGTNNLGGAGAVLRVCTADCADGLSLRSPAAVQMALGIAATAPAAQAPPIPEGFGRRGPPAQIPAPAPGPAPTTNSLVRHAQYEQIRGQFTAAKSYGAGKPTRREQSKELLLRAIKAEIPVRIEIHHEDDIQNALQLAGEFNLAVSFERVERVQTLPEQLRSGRSSLVVGPLFAGRPSNEVRTLALDGRRFAIGTFGSDPRATAGLRLHAAAAVAAGYPRDRVIKALTADAADMLGVGDRLGRIAVGRSADLAVFAGDPLDPSATVRLTISQGTVTCSASAADSAPLPSNAKFELPTQLPTSYVIKTTRLLNATGEFAPGELRVVDGRFSARGANGENTAVFDVGDTPVTPGFLGAHVSIASELSPDADAAHLKATDAAAADDARVRACRDAGFLTAVVAPGSNNVIAGVAGIVRPDAAADSGVKFVLTAAARTSERYPVSLGGQVELVHSRLFGAEATTNMHLPPAVAAALFAQRDQALQAVRDRRLPAIFEAHTRAEIRAALRLIAEHKLRGVLLMPREVDELAEEIRHAGVAVIMGPVKPQDPEHLTKGLVALGTAGVPICFGGEPADMRLAAAWLVNYGMPRAVARLALVGHPAATLGLPEGTNRLQAGDAADFVLWTGDPLDLTSRPAALLIQGQRVAGAVNDDAPEGAERRPGPVPARTGRRGR